MTTVTPNRIIVVDTNVWLDLLLPNRVHARESRAFIAAATQKKYGLAYPVHSLKDIFFLVCSEMKQRARDEKGALSEHDALTAREIAWSCVEYVRNLATAVGADESDAWFACKYRSLNGDLEDNFVLAAAKRANAAFLVTSDETLLRKATVETHTPGDAAALLAL